MPTPEEQARAALNSLLSGGAAPSGAAPSGASITPTTGTGGFNPYGTGAAIVGKIQGRPLAGWDDPQAWDNAAASYWGIEVLDEPMRGPTLTQDNQYGQLPPGYSGPEPPAAMGPYAVATPRPVSAIMQTLMNMSSRERILLQSKLNKAGYLPDSFKPGAADDQTINALSEVLLETARQGIASGESVSWQDYLDERIQSAESEEAKAAQSRTFTQTSSSVTTKESGRGVIWDAFRDAVGRNPTESEIDRFMARLNERERANPTVTTTTVDADGNSSSSTSGGIDAAARADMVRQEVEGNDEYAEYQAAAFYMPLLFQALDGTTQLDGGL